MEDIFYDFYYLIKEEKDFHVIEESNFFLPRNVKDYLYFNGEFLEKKDYFILKKFFRKYFRDFSKLDKSNFKTKEGKVCFLSLEDYVNEGFPKEILNLDKLEFLDFSGGCIKEVPKNIYRLENLTHLFLNDCELSHLPYEIVKLEILEYFSILGNKDLDKDSLNLVQYLRESGRVKIDFNY
jgi:Leucine-rich repeat (LRR) protein